MGRLDDELLFIVLAVITAATALNLFLTLRLAAILRGGAERAPQLERGAALPEFDGLRQSNGGTLRSAELAGQAAVLVFLSPACPACAGKVAELDRILPAIRSAEIALWIAAGDGTHDLGELLRGTPLTEHALALEENARLALNPARAVPFYIFVDDRRIVQASGYIGDPDWRSFIAQMDEIAATA